MEKLLLSTYSLIGVHCSAFVGEDACETEKKTEDFDSKDLIVLRLALSEKAQVVPRIAIPSLEIIPESGTDATEFRGYQLTGRYDLSVSLAYKDFVKLYPTIIQYKFFPDLLDVTDFTNQPMKVSTVEDLKKLIEQGYFDVINERILFYPRNLQQVSGLKSLLRIHSQKNMSQLRSISEDMRRAIKKLRETNEANKVKTAENIGCEVGKMPLRMKSIFNELERMIEQTESTLNSRDDQKLNLVMALELIQIFSSSIDRYLDYYQQQAIGLNELLRSIEAGVSGVGKYINQLSIVNFNNYQSPNYALKLASSITKMSLAYGEVLHLHSFQYREFSGPSGINSVLQPFLLPDSDSGHPELEFLFQDFDTGILRIFNSKYLDDWLKSNRLMVVTSPSYELFANPSQLIPLLLHEMGHFLHPKDRKKRNAAFSEWALMEECKFLFEGLIAQATKMSMTFFSDLYEVFVCTLCRIIRREIDGQISDELFASYENKLSYAVLALFEASSEDYLEDIIQMAQNCENLLHDNQESVIQRIKPLSDILNRVKKNQEEICLLAKFTPLLNIDMYLKSSKFDELYDNIQVLGETFDLFHCAFFRKELVALKKDIESMIKSHVQGHPEDEAGSSAAYAIVKILETLPQNKRWLTSKNLTEYFGEIYCCVDGLKSNPDIATSLKSKLTDFKDQKILYFEKRWLAFLFSFESLQYKMRKFSSTDTAFLALVQQIRPRIFGELYRELIGYVQFCQRKIKSASYYSVLYQIGINEVARPEIGEKTFLKAIENVIKENRMGRMAQVVFLQSKSLYRETIADVIMALSCGMSPDEYKVFCKKQLHDWNYRDGDDYQTDMRIQYASQCIESAASADAGEPDDFNNGNILWKKYYRPCFENSIGSYREYFIQEKDSPLYSDLRTLFSNPSLQRQIEFILRYYHRNRFRMYRLAVKHLNEQTSEGGVAQ